MLKVYSGKELNIDHSLIDHHALHILERLQSSGFTAYLVGGSVRDLIFQRHPKDFDIATSAEPEEIKTLFRSTLLIGRRFRLAHVRFGKKIFEVSTFRAGSNDDSDLIIRDNKWGNPEEDALRRDFTINGLFYDASTDSVIDYVNGCHDLKKKVLKTIGDPEIRFKQDPVRMVRLLKFHTRLDLSIDPETLNALQKCRGEIIKSAPARIMEEMLRMLESGYSEKFFRALSEHEILEYIFPWLQDSYDIYKYLHTADSTQLHISRPVFFTCLIYPFLEEEIQKHFLDGDKDPNLGNIGVIIRNLLRDVVKSSLPLIPRRMQGIISYLLNMQYRLTPLNDKVRRSIKPAHNRDFRYALQFLHLRAEINNSLASKYRYWSKIWHEHHPKYKKPYKKGPRQWK